MLECRNGGQRLSTAAKPQHLSRRSVLALPLLALAGPARSDQQDEIVVVDGWVLRRSDLAKL